MATEISPQTPVSAGDALFLVALYGVAVSAAAIVLALIAVLVLRLTLFSRPSEQPTAFHR
jgi:hypothetical protein